MRISIALSLAPPSSPLKHFPIWLKCLALLWNLFFKKMTGMNIADFNISWGNIMCPLLPPFSSLNLGVTLLKISNIQVSLQCNSGLHSSLHQLDLLLPSELRCSKLGPPPHLSVGVTEVQSFIHRQAIHIPQPSVFVLGKQYYILYFHLRVICSFFNIKIKPKACTCH